MQLLGFLRAVLLRTLCRVGKWIWETWLSELSDESWSHNNGSLVC